LYDYSLVCKNWAEILKDDLIWKALAQKAGYLHYNLYDKELSILEVDKIQYSSDYNNIKQNPIEINAKFKKIILPKKANSIIHAKGME